MLLTCVWVKIAPDLTLVPDGGLGCRCSEVEKKARGMGWPYIQGLESSQRERQTQRHKWG